MAITSLFGLFVDKDEDVVAQLIHSVAAEEEAATVDKEAKKQLKLAAKKEKAAAKKKLDEWKQNFWSQPQRMRAKRIIRGPRYVPKVDDDERTKGDEKKDGDEKTKGGKVNNEGMERKNNYQGGNYRGNYDNRKNRNVNTKLKKEEQIPLSKEEEEDRKQGWEVIKRRPTSRSGSSNGDGRSNTNYRGRYSGNQFSNNGDYRQDNNNIARNEIKVKNEKGSGEGTNNGDYRQDNNNIARNEIKVKNEKGRDWESVNRSGEGIIANNNGGYYPNRGNQTKQIPLTAEFVRRSLFVTPRFIIKEKQNTSRSYEEQDHKGGAHEEGKEKKKGGVAEKQNVKEKKTGGGEVEKVKEKKNGGAELQKVKQNNRGSNYNAASFNSNQRKAVPVAVIPVPVPIKVVVKAPDTSSAKAFPALSALKVKA